jgi:hypothetical protein
VQVFQNGYTRFALPCRFFRKAECFDSAAFNDAAVISGDELVSMIRLNSVDGIIDLIDENILDMIPLVGSGFDVIAEDRVANFQIGVGDWAGRAYGHGIGVQAPVHPHDAVAHLEACILNGAC